MGLYDKVRFELALPEMGISKGSIFETKSLRAGLANFSINVDGKLVEHVHRYESDPNNPSPLHGKLVGISDNVIDYHGDLLLIGPNGADIQFEIVARFTNGRLEWIQPVAQYPDANRGLLLEQGAR